MLQRCSNPNSTGYKNWGGRGIKVCKRWKRIEFDPGTKKYLLDGYE